MILIVGAMGAGKKEYVKSLGYGEECFGADIFDGKPVLYGLHEVISNNGFDEVWIPELLGKEIICCNEVGCGIVPLDAGERKWRDEVGRACSLLAKEADAVIRVACGIAIAIKGVSPCE